MSTSYIDVVPLTHEEFENYWDDGPDDRPDEIRLCATIATLEARVAELENALRSGGINYKGVGKPAPDPDLLGEDDVPPPCPFCGKKHYPLWTCCGRNVGELEARGDLLPDIDPTNIERKA